MPRAPSIKRTADRATKRQRQRWAVTGARISSAEAQRIPRYTQAQPAGVPLLEDRERGEVPVGNGSAGGPEPEGAATQEALAERQIRRTPIAPVREPTAETAGAESSGMPVPPARTEPVIARTETEQRSEQAETAGVDTRRGPLADRADIPSETLPAVEARPRRPARAESGSGAGAAETEPARAVAETAAAPERARVSPRAVRGTETPVAQAGDEGSKDRQPLVPSPDAAQAAVEEAAASRIAPASEAGRVPTEPEAGGPTEPVPEAAQASAAEKAQQVAVTATGEAEPAAATGAPRPAAAPSGGAGAIQAPEAASEPGGPSEEAEEEQTEARMAAAGGGESRTEMAEGEVTEEPSESDEREADAEAAAVLGPEAQALLSTPPASETESVGPSTAQSAESAESGLERAEAAGDGLAEEERAADDAEEQSVEQPAPGEPSPAGLAAAGGAGMADRMAQVESADGEPETGEAVEGPELPPAERDAALGVVAEDVGGGGVPSGGGGGGSAIPDPQAVEAPDVTAAEPSQALAALGNLPPARLQAALGGVNASVSRSVGEQRTELAANPPEMERPSGAPATREGPVTVPPPPSAGEPAPRTQQAPEGQAAPTPAPAPLPPPPAAPTERVAAPRVQGGAQGEMSAGDAAQLRPSLRRLPTRDPGLEVSAGAPPALRLEGNANPARTREQRGQLDRSMSQAQAQGRRDAAQPLGEDQIYPQVAAETLRATIPGGAGPAGGSSGGAAPAAGGPAGGGVGAADEAASIIAQERSGGQIRAAVASARGEMATQRRQHNQRASEQQANARQEIAALEADNASQQSSERTRARAAVREQRAQWTQAQQSEVDTRRQEADREQERGNQDIATERRRGENEASARIAEGDREAATARRQGEQEASRERRRGEQETGGVFGWLASRARAFFDGIKRGIQAAFERARALVRAAIERAKRLAVAVIERARQAIVATIRRVGAALIAIGDRLLARFPALRDRFRRAIQERVAAAEAVVNRLADRLRAGVLRALNALGAALDAALGLLERGLLAAVDAVNSVVQGAIRAARAVAEAVGAFVALIRDVAANPGQWLRNLGAAIMDGIRNHLWRAFQEEVQRWFNTKLEQVLGLGTAIWNLLRQGGMSLARIGRMVWQGIQSAIPPALIQLLVERLVAMLVPAAAAVMAIIEGLQAAWGAASQIIRAFTQFFAFLRQVKFGNAGPHFARALAAAAVAVIDFVSMFLLRRLVRPARRIGARIRAIAQRIGRRLRSAARRVAGAARRGARRVGAAVRRTGRRIAAGARRAAARLRRGRRGPPRSAAQRRRDRAERRERQRRERHQRAMRMTTQRINRLLARGVGPRMMRIRLLLLKVRYRWRRLVLRKQSRGRYTIEGQINPPLDLYPNISFDVMPSVGVSVQRAQVQRDWESRERFERRHGRTDYEYRDVRSTGRESYEQEVIQAAVVQGRNVQPALEAIGGVLPVQRTPRRARVGQQRPLASGQAGYLAYGSREIRHPALSERGGPVPDYVVEQQAAGGQVVQSISFEVTLDAKLRQSHKRTQMRRTIENIRMVYRQHPQRANNFTIVYTIIAPEQPNEETQNLIDRELRTVGWEQRREGQSPRIRVLWIVVPLAG